MPKKPNQLSDRPNPSDPAEQDVLSDVLASLQMATLLYGRMELGAPWRLQFPDKNAAHVHVVVRGGAQLRVKDQPDVVLAAGDVVLVPHRGAHTLWDGRGGETQKLECGSCSAEAAPRVLRGGGSGAQTVMVSLGFLFGEATRGPLFESLPPLVHVAAHAPGTPPQTGALVQLLLSESAAAGPGSSVMVKRLGEMLMVQALRAQMAGGECAGHGMRALADAPVGRALGLIHRDFARAWTVEALAQRVGLSRSGFAARFAQMVGEPPLEYVTRWRMLKAAEMLRGSGFTLGQVAERVGYTSEPAFHRAFKRWQGTSPGAYRRQRERGVTAPATGL